MQVSPAITLAAIREFSCDAAWKARRDAAGMEGALARPSVEDLTPFAEACLPSRGGAYGSQTDEHTSPK
ncbi:uncharacterized protein SCHCODRAFT_01305434 [Schizophyllum commune H4-8]|uniref:uncharacterized protein n=1 Tax=Schizophyllum commune (strain H4-8 / FGSC 9210) TaxID=578458 RepID=UPI00215FB290|nr:uncharacterized protein SCHCODRAFT_01305434 [Schizophyllum commune H4-8]KAI5892899.1 hypothetical protein SCHCODRAFT_01305434 [Schizophyllum commune H4-8]